MLRWYEPRTGETAMLYELGIPVVETGDRWHINIEQKVPLNTDRDNVIPAFLRDVRALTVNAMADQLTEDDSAESWVTAALEDDRVEDEAVEKVLDRRFGEKRVAYDPSDLEANQRAAAEGYTVVHGRSLSGKAWEQVKRAEALPPAGQVTPAPRVELQESGALDKAPYEPDEYMENVAAYTVALAEKVMGVTVAVSFVCEATASFGACYARQGPMNGSLTFNVGRLGKRWFRQINARTDDLLLDEFGHQTSSNHLSVDYYQALRQLGAAMVDLALKEPEFYAKYGREVKELELA